MKTRFLIMFTLVLIIPAINESFADELIEIKLEQKILVDDLELYFHDIEDSRCPLDVTCIWEGNVTVMISVKNQTHRVSGYFTPGYTLSYIAPYDITLVDIKPHPISTEDADYVATINISQLENDFVNDINFRDTSGEILCKGHTSNGGFLEFPECGPIDQFVTHVLVIILPIAGIVTGFIIWRKRK